MRIVCIFGRNKRTAVRYFVTHFCFLDNSFSLNYWIEESSFGYNFFDTVIDRDFVVNRFESLDHFGCHYFLSVNDLSVVGLYAIRQANISSCSGRIAEHLEILGTLSI